MRVYIAGPIAGISDYVERFKAAEEKWQKRGHEVINPAALDLVLPESMTYEEHMEMDFLLIKGCDAVYMLSGWQQSRGANREYGYALGAGKKIWFEEGT